MTLEKPSTEGTVHEPRYYEGIAYNNGDVHQHTRYFTYKTDAGLVASSVMTVMFTVDRPVKEIWPHFKDFNRWQNSHGYFYSGVVGDLYSSAVRDLGKETVSITLKKPNEPVSEYPFHYEVLTVIPEHLIVLFQPIPKDGSNGGVSPGFHVLTLNEHDGKTVINYVGQHGSRTQHTTDDEALAPWRKYAPEIQRFWLETFIPTLKRLVYEGR